TDEDWASVKMALISGRPISFKMDLYNPLFVSRPTVEPELFASLRPPTYSGGFKGEGLAQAVQQNEAKKAGTMAGKPAAPGGGGSGGRGGSGTRLEEEQLRLAKDADESPAADRRRHAVDVGRELAAGLRTGAVGNAATGGQLGDFFQYAIDHPVSLARQKS